MSDIIWGNRKPSLEEQADDGERLVTTSQYQPFGGFDPQVQALAGSNFPFRAE